MELFLRLRKEIALGKGDVRMKDSGTSQWVGDCVCVFRYVIV